MVECIFCKIIEGKLPSQKVYEDSYCVAFLDIAPVNKGHTLVVPKEHAELLDQLSDSSARSLAIALKKLVPAVRAGSRADGINIVQSNGRAAGQLVPHTHFHIIPRYANDGLRHWPQGSYASPDEAAQIAEKIRAAAGG